MSTPFAAIRAGTLTSRRRVQASAFDCVRFVVIRDGSLLIDYTNRVEPVSIGDVVMVAPHTAIGYEPEGKTTVLGLSLEHGFIACFR
ncbi:hypothetical protein HCA58_13980 [Micromonospora sp. HNM0581]|uniref:hypothetical protein n=1 Tax=Micromonospora sp. HNM0581 TaxID=2716341 RepID=UPI00146BE342|nr:hypothetical protein [Micromonospora sp. HNM0581]NLU79471.1 hypothetical protein [Micromonospora sp. HNM0581]